MKLSDDSDVLTDADAALLDRVFDDGLYFDTVYFDEDEMEDIDDRLTKYDLFHADDLIS